MYIIIYENYDEAVSPGIKHCESLSEAARYIQSYVRGYNYEIYKLISLENNEETVLAAAILTYNLKAQECSSKRYELYQINNTISQKQATVRKKRELLEDARYELTEDSRTKRFKQIQDLEQEVIDLRAKEAELKLCLNQDL